ncbi:MAG: sugar kinase [Anaerolineales bacterium]|nr:sugar kinase [Anaerolineales bacterium]
MTDAVQFNILADDLSTFAGRDPAFVTFGETMIRETPADMQRAERTRKVDLSLSGSEHILCVGLSRLGIPCRYITRAPDNPYGWMLRNVSREQGIDTSFFVWADKAELMGRYIYEIGRTPRRSTAWYQRKFSAASRLGAGMVDWQAALHGADLLHISGITLGLALHSGYERNYNLEAFQDALSAKPMNCKIGMDFNYRGTLWSVEDCRKVMTPVITETVDWFITTIEDMARIYGLGCGRYSADQINRGDIGSLSDTDLKTFASRLQEKFKVEIVGVTIRYPDSFEVHRWESVALDGSGNFSRSPEIKPIVLGDRIGGGDTWNSGFYYGLLTEPDTSMGIQKGILVGDAISRLKQTLMFDLGIVTKEEVHGLIKADMGGSGKRESR